MQQGLLFIGDPHLANKQPDFRKDNYEQTCLKKFEWCLKHSRDEHLIPIVLGDLFDSARKSSCGLICDLIDLIQQPLAAILGNHDIKDNELTKEDSISILIKSRKIRLLDDNPINTTINERPVLIGGNSWQKKLDPREVLAKHLNHKERPLVFWACHHSLNLPDHAEGKIPITYLENVDVVVNGHIHTAQRDQVKNTTHWLTPGNIIRTKRGSATEQQLPSVLRIDINRAGWRHSKIEVPHEPYHQVFYEKIPAPSAKERESRFVSSLAEMEKRKTQTGAGLQEFLDANLPLFSEQVGTEIKKLYQEVIDDA